MASPVEVATTFRRLLKIMVHWNRGRGPLLSFDRMPFF